MNVKDKGEEGGSEEGGRKFHVEGWRKNIMVAFFL